MSSLKHKMLSEENTTSLYQVEEMPGMTVKSSWRLCLILLGWLFTYNHSLLAQSIEWSRSPAYLTPAQVHDDLVAAKQLIRENYVHYERLQQVGHDWDQVFSELRSQLLENPRPMLTQHFQEKLLDALQFTEDPVFRADLHLPRRHYQTRIPLVEPRFTDLRLAKQGDRFRVLPDQKFPGLANLWLNECDHPSVRLFPILPERIREERVMLGIYASEFPERIRCEFVDELNRKVTRELLLQRIVKELVSPRQTLFQADEGRVFYVRWLRDGRKEETAVRDFYLLPERMGSARTLIRMYGTMLRAVFPLLSAGFVMFYEIMCKVPSSGKSKLPQRSQACCAKWSGRNDSFHNQGGCKMPWLSSEVFLHRCYSVLKKNRSIPNGWRRNFCFKANRNLQNGTSG